MAAVTKPLEMTAEEKLAQKKARRAAYQRARRANMSEEEHQRILARRRSKPRGVRRVLSEEERLKRNKVKREQIQKRWQLTGDEEYDLEQKRQFCQKRNELKKKRKSDMKEESPERYREYLDKVRFCALRRTLAMTDEKKEEKRRIAYLSKKAKLATLSPEELERRRKLNVASSIRSQKKRRANATEEERQLMKIKAYIHLKKGKLRKQLFEEGLPPHEVKRKADEMEEIWWKERRPEGKPPRRWKGTSSAPVWQPPKTGQVDTESDRVNLIKPVKLFNFNCMKCHPLWLAQGRSWQPVGFDSKLELCAHVMENHRSSYFLCEECKILKYSQAGFELHLRFCSKNVPR